MLSAFQEVQENEFECSQQYTDYARRIANQKQWNRKKKPKHHPQKKQPKKKATNQTQGKKEIEINLEKVLWKNRVESDRISAIHLYIILGEFFF